MKHILLSTRLILVPALILLFSGFKCGGPAKAVADKPATTPAFNLITEKQFNDLFPQRDKFYTYTAFMQAIKELGMIRVKITRRAVSVYQFIRTDKNTGKATVIRQDADWNEAWAKVKPDSTYIIDYGNFCNERDPLINKKELAAFFANVAHETRHGLNGSYTDGLMLIHEDNTSLDYFGDSDEYPPVKGKKYYGRGPLQLSFNGNYGYASDMIFGDRHILLNNPDLVTTNPVVAFKAAIYFWMTPQTRKPSAHDVMTGKWQPDAADKAAGRVPGFGMVINIINGALECNLGENNPGMLDRIGFYQHFLARLGVTDANCACSCGKMQHY
ncbi:chitinase [Mucilaginibacter sp. UR6-11]|uniref:chitinase n=1 Tax=Mucilaginibacter sp. UR6-11 TaxID=1435644 RepID=UPI001E4504F5|nr:chitinase [Mucilaginibacter sp. UR6-11]